MTESWVPPSKYIQNVNASHHLHSSHSSHTTIICSLVITVVFHLFSLLLLLPFLQPILNTASKHLIAFLCSRLSNGLLIEAKVLTMAFESLPVHFPNTLAFFLLLKHDSHTSILPVFWLTLPRIFMPQKP